MFDKVTVKDGLQELGLLADLEKVPLKAHLKNGDIDDTSKYAIYRKPTKQDKKYRQISDRVGKDYEILQPSQLAKILDPISKQYPVETIGVDVYPEPSLSYCELLMFPFFSLKNLTGVQFPFRVYKRCKLLV